MGREVGLEPYVATYFIQATYENQSRLPNARGVLYNIQ